MLYLYAKRTSDTEQLADTLHATRLSSFDGLDFWKKSRRFSLTPGDSVICWGQTIPPIEGVRVLNSAEKPMNKYVALRKLANTVPTLNSHKRTGEMKHIDFLRAGYIGRMFDAKHGEDLLFPPAVPDFYVAKQQFGTEYVLHSFSGRSIRAGKKFPRYDVNEVLWQPDVHVTHPWVRTELGGWGTTYDGVLSTGTLRNLAGKALKGLGLTFGAVCIGTGVKDDSMTVLSVDTGPTALDEKTFQAYVRALQRWIRGDGENQAREEAMDEV